MKSAEITVLGWLCFLATANAARILAVFPMAARSHFGCYEVLMKSLHDAGHHLTVISSFPDHESLKGYKVIDSNQAAMNLTGKFIPNIKDMSFIALLKLSTEIEERTCRNVLQLPEVQSMLSSTQRMYDLMFVEISVLHECFFPIANKLDVPIIGIITTRYWHLADTLVGNSINPAAIPAATEPYSDQMTFFQRLNNVRAYLLVTYHQHFIAKPILQHIYNDFYATDLQHTKKLSLLFSNDHFSIMPRSLVPNAINIGGIHLKPANPLPQNLQDFIDGAERGVILFTFGSIIRASGMSSSTVTAFKEAFARIPQRVIWKFEETIENLSDNVLTLNWLPQNDILAHKNVKAFITHCGISGVYEALHHSVPVIVSPIFGDQAQNAAALVKLEVGVYLDASTTSTEAILEALNAVINDTRYTYNMRRLSKLFEDRPMSIQETITYWTEYVIRHNGALHLRTASADMPLHQYLLLDIILFVIATIFLTVYVAFYGTKCTVITFIRLKRRFLNSKIQKKCE